MAERTKYDVIEEETLKASRYISESMFKLTDLYFDVDAEFISYEEGVSRLTDLVRSVAGSFKTVAHLGYESAKDFWKINFSDIEAFITSNNISLNDFSFPLEKIINQYCKTIYIFMVFEEEEYDLAVIDDVVLLLKVFDGYTEGLIPYLNSKGIEFSPENSSILSRMSDKNFSLLGLNQNQIDRLNRYHDDYMKRRINPKITLDENEQEKILCRAKQLSIIGKKTQ